MDINHQPADVARDEAANHFCFLAIVLGNGLAGQMRDPNSSVSLVEYFHAASQHQGMRARHHRCVVGLVVA